ncbi:MAG TPA: hypothetical protein VFN97_01675 [Actinospica sp.]|nr:hypothetical protein [Actinospica sp.]
MTTYRAELLRSRTRGTYCFLALCLSLFVFGMANAEPQHHLPLYGFRQASILAATLVMGRAVTVAAGDFGGGAIRPWLISSPRRGAVCLGKLAASLTVAAAFSVAAGAVGFAMSAALGTTPTFADVGSVAGELLLACLGFTVFGHAVALLVRNVPVALAVSLGWILAAEHLLGSGTISSWLPGLVSQKITKGEIAGSDYAAALARVFVPFIAIEAVALIFFLRRDVNS